MLMDLVAGCRSANQVNGYIIHTRRSQLQQLLGVVRGAAPLTYTAQGKTHARAHRALAKA
jgi:flagellar biosynthesis/type III secretory pathway chaperone